MRLFIYFVPILIITGPVSVEAQSCSWSRAATRAGIAALLLGSWEASELGLKRALAESEPKWVDNNINPLDRLGEAMRWSPGELDEGAASLSDNLLGMTIVSSSLVAFAGESTGACLVEDIAAVGEAAGVALLLNQSIKFLARRERPFARDLSPEERGEICLSKRDCADLNLSFFSGHSTMGFAAALAAGTVARQRGYPSALAAYSFGVLGAGLTAYLRVAAGKHYLSDVLLGTLVGGAAGILVPRYLHPVEGKQESVTISPFSAGTFGISLGGVF